MSMVNDDASKPKRPVSQAEEADIAGPRLTPQGRVDPDAAGEDATDPNGGAKQGQRDKAEG